VAVQIDEHAERLGGVRAEEELLEGVDRRVVAHLTSR